MDCNSTKSVPTVSVFSPKHQNWENIDVISPVKFEAEHSEPASVLVKEQTSVTFEVKPNKQLRKWYREQTRAAPDWKYPKKKRAWRLKKKWFNRYQKPRLLGQTIGFEGELGKSYPAKIVKAQIRKSGNNTSFIDFCAEPLINI